MKIPNRDRAIIEQTKITEYLLNTQHKRGGSKAKMLLQFGYSLENWQQLESDLRQLARSLGEETSLGSLVSFTSMLMLI